MAAPLHFPFRPPGPDAEKTIAPKGDYNDADLVQRITANPSFAAPPPTRERGPFIIGVAGGSAAGKALVCHTIMDALGAAGSGAHTKVSNIRLEDFYKPLGPKEIDLDNADEYNFDHPDALDLELLESCLKAIANGEPVDIPQYDFQHRQRLPQTTRIEAPDVVILSGILILYQRSLRDLIDLKVFVDVDSDARLARQIIRDTEERHNFSLERVLQRYIKLIKPSFEEFILPTKKFADVIIPRGESNTIAVSLLTHHIVDIVRERAAAAASPSTVSSGKNTSASVLHDKIRSVADAAVQLELSTY